MTNNAEGDRAIAALNGKEVGGRALNVNEAKPKSEGASRGGRRWSWKRRWWRKRTLLI